MNENKGRDFVIYLSFSHKPICIYKDRKKSRFCNQTLKRRLKREVLDHGFIVEIERLEILLVWERNEEAMEERYGLGFWEERIDLF